MTIRVLVADDQSMVRAGFRMLLSGEEDIEVVAEASNGLEAVEKAARFDPSVILMDIRMPELDGLQATQRILAADNAARILILTTFDLDEYVFEALRAGASGFVLKDDSPEQLIAAIRTVAEGEALLSPTITRSVIQKFVRIRVRLLRTSSGSSVSENATSFACWLVGSQTRRSVPSSTSARRPSRLTSLTSFRSSTFAIACRQSCSRTRPASSSQTPRFPTSHPPRLHVSAGPCSPPC